MVLKSDWQIAVSITLRQPLSHVCAMAELAHMLGGFYKQQPVLLDHALLMQTIQPRAVH